MNKYPVIISRRAREDIQTAVKWYNSRQKGLGRRFYLFVKQGISTLESTPFLEIRYNEVRCLKIKRYPYLIHYLVDGDKVYVLAVINTSQDPETHWVG